MKRIISFDTSVMFSLFLLGMLILFHGCILIGILFFDAIPTDFLWGGKMTSVSQLLNFEIVSLLTSSIFFFLLLIRSKWLNLPKLMGIARIAMWVVFFIFLLNTIGNLMATNSFEKWFAISTGVLSFLFLRIAIENNTNSI